MKKIKLLFKKRFTENLRFSDLKKSAGLSDLTSEFRKERNAKKQRENIVAKLVYAEYNEKDDSVLFQFITPATDKYKKDYKYKATNPDGNFNLINLPGKKYTMEFKILKFKEWLETAPNEITDQDILDVLNVADVQFFCDCPSFHWQGMNYISSTFDASIYPTEIAPKHWNKYHNDDNFLCKHLQGLINQIQFFIPQMKQKIKGLNK